MGTGLASSNATVVSAFQSALRHQSALVGLLLAVMAIGWSAMHLVWLRRQEDAAGPVGPGSGSPEPAARRLLRISFGALWIFDGLLQAQASMPLGMAPQVIKPAAASSPGWVQHLVNAAATVWSYHPVTAPVAAVWIQVGIGAWLIVSPRGEVSRLAGVVSIGWGLVVWIFGESFGGIFAPGLSWMFGAPGAVVFYCLAGALIALPEGSWAGLRTGKAILGAMGGFFVAMAVLQAWPGRGFWQGQVGADRTAGSLTGMVAQMATTPQPRLFASWVASFASFDAAHGWAVNLFVVVALAAVGGALLAGAGPVPRLARWGAVAAAVLGLADWVLVQDLGFFGGVGTDPNSMIPITLIVAGGYVAIRRPSGSVAPVTSAAGVVWRPGLARIATDRAYGMRVFGSVGAVVLVVIGAAPMAVAATEPHADPIIASAIDGTPLATDKAAPGFVLTDQYGRSVSLAGLRGKSIALTFLDPVCTSDCPVIAQEFKAADNLLGHDQNRIEMVAVDVNPSYRSTAFLTAFDQEEHLEGLPNWLYLTGSLPQLERVWSSFGQEVQVLSGGSMILHDDIAYVIDPTGHIRFVLDSDPGPQTDASKSSFAALLDSVINRSMSRT